MPKMRHATNGHEIDVKPDMAAMYETQGWREVKPKRTPKTSAAKKSAAKPRKK